MIRRADRRAFVAAALLGLVAWRPATTLADPSVEDDAWVHLVVDGEDCLLEATGEGEAMTPQENNPGIKLAATTALANAMQFIKGNFKQQVPACRVCCCHDPWDWIVLSLRLSFCDMHGRVS